MSSDGKESEWMGCMGGKLKENLTRKRNLCLRRMHKIYYYLIMIFIPLLQYNINITITKHVKWAKGPGTVPCDWTKKQWGGGVPGAQLAWDYTWKSVDIEQNSDKSCWLDTICFLRSINCDQKQTWFMCWPWDYKGPFNAISLTWNIHERRWQILHGGIVGWVLYSQYSWKRNNG